MATASKARKAPGNNRVKTRETKAPRKREMISDIFARRDSQVRRGEFEILGRLTGLRMLNKAGEIVRIEFQGRGATGVDRRPMLAKVNDRSKQRSVGYAPTDGAPAAGAKAIVFLDPWEQFPALYANTEELCDACRATCTYCHGEPVACQMMRCGGRGHMVLSYEACTAPKCQRETGKANPKCKVCGGCGQVEGQTAECPTCKGTKVQTCATCQGSGEMSTGRLNGASRDRETNAPDCPECHGNGRKQKRTDQPWEPHMLGKLEGYTVLGPIESLVFLADAYSRDRRHYEEIRFAADEDGNLAALFVKQPEKTGQPVYIFGGNQQLSTL